jgi:holo-[acyl-carrier protein] synthase
MILGIGFDMVSIPRMAALLQRHGERARQRLFAPGEVHYCQQRARPAASYAARFAAKEALLKALATGLSGGMTWTEIEVVAAASGAPTLRLSGTTAQRAATIGTRRIHLSLTHTDELAGACVVLES